jgi:hypothetical protein
MSNATATSAARPDLDTWLQSTLAEATVKFPDIGLFLMAVDTNEAGEADISAASNIPHEDVPALLIGYAETESLQVTQAHRSAN